MKPNLQWNHTQMEQIFSAFQTDYVGLLSHIENSFLRNVWTYIFNSTYYVEWASKDFLMSSLLDKRKILAEKIIQFIKNDKSINQIHIKEFIDKWNV